MFKQTQILKMIGRSVYVKCVKIIFFTIFYCGLGFFYIYLGQMNQDQTLLYHKSGDMSNKVEKVHNNVHKDDSDDDEVDDNPVRDEWKESDIKAFEAKGQVKGGKLPEAEKENSDDDDEEDTKDDDWIEVWTLFLNVMLLIPCRILKRKSWMQR